MTKHSNGVSPRGLASSVAACLLAAATTTLLAQGLPANLFPTSGTKAAPAPNVAAPTADEWAARLAAARIEHRQLLDQAPGSAPLLSERQLTSARRLVLLSARAEAARSQSAAGSAADRPVRPPPTLSGPPPYSMLDVDTLRDHLDGLLAQRSALRLTLKLLDDEIQSSMAERGTADANLRLQREPSTPAQVASDPVRLRAQLELAELRAQVADLEVVQADTARQRARERLASLSDPIAQLEREVERVRSQQQLSDAEIDKLLKESNAERRRLDAERAKLAEQLARRESEAAKAGPAAARELEILHHTVVALRELEAIERNRSALWRGRQDALAARADRTQAKTVAATLTRGIEQVQARLRNAAEQGELLRAELTTQQSLVRGLAADDPTRPGEQRVLDALQSQLGVQEHLRDLLGRANVLLSRSRDDLGVTDRPGSASGWFEHGYGVLAGWLGSVWNYELFSATETAQIDGRAVTVEHGVTVGKSVGVLLMLAIGYWSAGHLSRLLVAVMAPRLQLSPQLASVLRRWINSILLLVVLLLVLRMARIPLTAFAFLGGALAIGVGFGAQNIIKNLISGVIILFERKIRVGDIVSIGGTAGTVASVDFRATTVHGFDGIDAIVPNSALLENQISNWSGGNPNMRRAIVLGIAYGSDVRKAAGLIADAVTMHPSVLSEPPPEVLFDDFGSDALVLRLLYWIRLGGPRGGPTVDSDLRYAIDDALRAAGIAIAFPQRDVHLDVAGPLQVELAGRSPNDVHP
jgi:potassium-dependent mechanosensitive channel